jgi:hypothetical protein
MKGKPVIPQKWESGEFERGQGACYKRIYMVRTAGMPAFAGMMNCERVSLRRGKEETID